MTILIKNGTVVSPTGRHEADVLVDDQQIAAVLQPGSDAAASAESGAEKVIDAAGKYVVPGGIDAHTHMELPFGGTFASDTFEIGTRAAAWGGTTTIIDFAVQRDGENVRESLDAWFAKAEGECAIDYGFHMILGGVDDAALKEMDNLVGEGITSFKLFMAYPGVFYSDDGQILRAMQKASDNGGLICMHAENGIAIDVLAEQAAARGQTDPVYHGITRPPALEGEATNRAIQLALVAGAPVYFVHLSASEALVAVAAARNDGHNVFAETCPQYLYLNLEDHLGAPGFHSVPRAVQVPLIPLGIGNLSPMVLVTVFLAVVVWWVLRRTQLGLWIRAVGENPAAADVAGLRVNTLRLGTAIAAGMLAGLAGAYLSVDWFGAVTKEITAGRGFIALATVVFSGLNPLLALLGGFIFGLFEGLATWISTYPAIKKIIPWQFVAMAPYIITLLVVAGAIGRVRFPKGLGVPYLRE